MRQLCVWPPAAGVAATGCSEELLQRAPKACTTWEGLGPAGVYTHTKPCNPCGTAARAAFCRRNARDPDGVCFCCYIGCCRSSELRVCIDRMWRSSVAATARSALRGVYDNDCFCCTRLEFVIFCRRYAALLCSRGGVDETLQLQRQLLQCLDVSVQLLSRMQQRLSLRQRNILREVSFFLSRVAAAAASAGTAVSAETRAFADAAVLSPPEGPLPKAPLGLDYSQLDLEAILSRTVLVASEGDTRVALHHAGVREVYVDLGQQQHLFTGDLLEVLPGARLLQEAPPLIAAESFSLACIASHDLSGLYQHSLKVLPAISAQSRL
ncbi:uncharacterized protein LOC34620178 [Cyclospora cayetanensis]|uniref:Uncharacterized protein LOC34620178 n=1 Tax=Cyclospora cayetanensis TaxID=88456 RepID=A0A6P6S0H0_9EIME|nr:uncharacterized protein LOC34620178 [Cyclospora cayetanensis]